jgi:hypothetical protein
VENRVWGTRRSGKIQGLEHCDSGDARRKMFASITTKLCAGTSDKPNAAMLKLNLKVRVFGDPLPVGGSQFNGFFLMKGSKSVRDTLRPALQRELLLRHFL